MDGFIWKCRDSLARGSELTRGSLVETPKVREYGIRVDDGGSSYLCFQYCPWCGAKLPQSLRELSFALSSDAQIDGTDEHSDDFRTDLWWKNAEFATQHPELFDKHHEESQRHE